MSINCGYQPHFTREVEEYCERKQSIESYSDRLTPERYRDTPRDREEIALLGFKNQPLEPTDIQRVLSSYDICPIDNDEILRILQRNDDVAHVLAEAILPTQRLFGKSRPLIEISRDPDSDGVCMIFATIRVNGNREEARNLMKKFRMDWWNQQPVSVREFLDFDMDVV